MEVSLESTDEMVPVQKTGQRYLGSVRFFKHMILSTIAILILVPVILCVVFVCKYRSLKGRYSVMEMQYADYVCHTEELQEQQSGRMQEMQAEIESLTVEKVPEQTPKEEKMTIPFSVDINAWNYILVNDTHPLPEGFQVDLVDTRNGKKVDRRIKYKLEKMLDDAGEEGFDLVVCSAYRDYEKQEELVDNSIKKYIKRGMDYETAFFMTKRQLERTGCSEHHLGLAVDIVGVSYQSLDEGQAETEEAKWLKEHAYQYGFILRYAKDKENITGIRQESWHFRYVGIEAATFMKEHNLCLEEFLELAQEQL